MKIVVDLTAREARILATAMADPTEWVDNLVRSRVRALSLEIVRAETAHRFIAGAPLPPDADALIDEAFAAGRARPLAERARDGTPGDPKSVPR